MHGAFIHGYHQVKHFVLAPEAHFTDRTATYKYTQNSPWDADKHTNIDVGLIFHTKKERPFTKF
jgi:hypothetical protein